MYLDNVPFCHILLRTNEALLDLIFGLSGCLDFLVSAFTFVITSLGNFSFPPQPISWVTIAWRLPPSVGFCSFQAPFPHPRDLKFSKHNGKFYLALIRSIKKAVNAPCYQTHFLSFFIFLLFTIAVLRTCYISFEEWIQHDEQLSTFLEFEGLKFYVITLICCLIKGSHDNKNSSANNNSSIHSTTDCKVPGERLQAL